MVLDIFTDRDFLHYYRLLDQVTKFRKVVTYPFKFKPETSCRVARAAPCNRPVRFYTADRLYFLIVTFTKFYFSNAIHYNFFIQKYLNFLGNFEEKENCWFCSIDEQTINYSLKIKRNFGYNIFQLDKFS